MMDLSRYDRVCSPVIILSDRLEVLYSNPVARRQYPFLANPGNLFGRYPADRLAKMSASLKKGNPVTVPYCEDLAVSLLLEPVPASDGSVSHICAYVVSDVDKKSEVSFPVADSDLLRAMDKYAAQPINNTLRRLQVAKDNESKYDASTLRQILDSVRISLLKTSLFFARTSVSVPQRLSVGVFCDASSVLLSCEKAFPALHVKGPENNYFVPVERDVMILLVADILATLYFRQGDKPKITAWVESVDGQTVLRFIGVNMIRMMDESCPGDDWGLEGGFASIRRRVEMFGGTLSVRSRGQNSATVIVTYPQIDFSRAELILEDDSLDGISLEEFRVLEFLKAVAGGLIKG